MQQPADSFPSSKSPSFAGLLAALTAPKTETAERRSGWDEDQLEDDVATLSYERALRANARYKPVDEAEWSLPKSFDLGSAAESLYNAVTAAAPPGRDGAQEVAAAKPLAAVEETRRRASVTVRLSEAEYQQLHKRAAEAGLTVSAYLRSCTFEAEALRAQVKAALAELRAGKAGHSGQVAEKAAMAKNAPRFSWRELWLRFLPRWGFAQRVARA